MELNEELLHITVLIIAIVEPLALFYSKRSKDVMEAVKNLIASDNERIRHEIALLRLQFVQVKDCDQHRIELEQKILNLCEKINN